MVKNEEGWNPEGSGSKVRQVKQKSTQEKTREQQRKPRETQIGSLERLIKSIDLIMLAQEKEEKTQFNHLTEGIRTSGRDVSAG